MFEAIDVVIDEEGVADLGAAIMSAFVEEAEPLLTIYLNGNLGMGKTTLTQSVIAATGYQGRVKSPTYTLVEPYELDELAVYHFDLYRLADPEELEFLGARDYFETEGKGKRICIIEWPEKGEGFLAQADCVIDISQKEKARSYHICACERLMNHLKRELDVRHLCYG